MTLRVSARFVYNAQEWFKFLREHAVSVTQDWNAHVFKFHLNMVRY